MWEVGSDWPNNGMCATPAISRPHPSALRVIVRGALLTFSSSPRAGEIDIVEGVNDYSNNQATIHTAHGCTIPSSSSSSLGITGNVVGGTNCAAAETNNAGCGMTATQQNTYGAGFNSNGGGVYASASSCSSPAHLSRGEPAVPP